MSVEPYEVVYARLLNRQDTAEEWKNVNPILEKGEWGYDTTNNKIKLGDGVTAWNDLAYFSGEGGGSGTEYKPGTGIKFTNGNQISVNADLKTLTFTNGIIEVNTTNIATVNYVDGLVGNIYNTLKTI
jgi:hypothetical protein